jgi:hypothetical protein
MMRTAASDHRRKSRTSNSQNLCNHPYRHRNRQLLHHITLTLGNQAGNELDRQLLGHTLPAVHRPLAEARLDLLA